MTMHLKSLVAGGATPIKLVGVYVVDKDKPLASPAAAPAGQ